jgi:hypothetical protein
MQKFATALAFAATAAATHTTSAGGKAIWDWMGDATKKPTDGVTSSLEIGNVASTNTTLGYTTTMDVFYSETNKYAGVKVTWNVNGGADSQWVKDARVGLGWNMAFGKSADNLQIPVATNATNATATNATATNTNTTNGTATSKSARLLAVTGDSLGTIVDCAFGADDAKTGTVAAPTCTSTSWTSKGNLLPKAAWNYTAAFTPKDGTKVDDVWSALPGVSMQRKAGNNTLTGSVGVVISDADATEYFGADGQTFSTALYSWAADTAKTASVVAAKAPTTVSINTKTGKVEARSIVAAASNATNATTSATALVGAISTVAVSAMIALF